MFVVRNRSVAHRKLILKLQRNDAWKFYFSCMSKKVLYQYKSLHGTVAQREAEQGSIKRLEEYSLTACWYSPGIILVECNGERGRHLGTTTRALDGDGGDSVRVDLLVELGEVGEGALDLELLESGGNVEEVLEVEGSLASKVDF